MSKPTLSPKFEKVSTPLQNAERNEQAIIQDVQKRLDAQKNAILWSKTIDETFLKDQYLSEVTTKIQNLILDKSPFVVDQEDIVNGWDVTLYYTASNWKVYQSEKITQNLNEAAAVKNTLWTTLEWIGRQKMELVKKAGKSVTDKDLLADLQLYTTDSAAFLKAWIEKNQSILVMNDQMVKEINDVKNEILQDMWSVEEIKKKVETVQWTIFSWREVKKILEWAIAKRELNCGSLWATEARKCQWEITELKALLETELPLKYIEQIVKNAWLNKPVPIHPDAPEPYTQPMILGDVEFALQLIEPQITNATDWQTKGVLETWKSTLSDIKEQLTDTKNNAEGKEMSTQFGLIYKQLREEVKDNLNEAVLQKIKLRISDQETLLVSKIAETTALDANHAAELWTLLAKIQTLGVEADQRILLEQKRTELQKKTQEIEQKQLEYKQEWKEKKDGTYKWKWLFGGESAKEVMQTLERDKQKLQHEIDQLDHQIRGFVWQQNANIPRATEVFPQVVEATQTSVQWVDAHGKSKNVNSVKELCDCYSDIDAQKQQELLTTFYTNGMTLANSGNRWKNRCKLSPRHQEFLIQYQTIAANDMFQSRAKSLGELTKASQEFNNAEFGTVRDFRLLAKKLKNSKDDEKKKAKYAKKALKCAFEVAYYENFNRNILSTVEALQANRKWLTAMQPEPTFVCGDPCEQVIGSVFGKVWDPNSGWSDLMSCMNKDEVMNILQECDFYKKLMKNGGPTACNRFNAVVQPYMYPGNVPGTSIHQPPGNPGNGVIIYDEKSKGYVVEWELTTATMLDLYLHDYLSVDTRVLTGMQSQESIKPHHAYNIVRRWLSSENGWFDLVGTLQRYASPKLSEHQIREISEKLIEDAMRYDPTLNLAIRERYVWLLNNYRNERSKTKWKDIVDRDVSHIPSSEKYRMLSIAAAQWLAWSMNLWSSDQRIKTQLQLLYWWSREQKQFVNWSNQIVGEDIARLMDKVRGESGYAISARSLNEFNSRENRKQQTNAHGIFWAAGNAITAWLQQFPWMTDRLAQNIWSIWWKAMQIAAIAFLIKWARDWVSSWEKFWWKLWKAWTLWLGVMLFGQDVKALLFWGKWWTIARAISYYTEKKDNFWNLDGMDARQTLSYTFGSLSLNQLMDMLEVNQNGEYQLKPTAAAGLMQLPWLSPGQKESIAAMFQWDRDSVSKMINQGLLDIGITPTNAKDKRALRGNKKLSDVINNNAHANSSLVEDILWPQSQAERDAHEQYINTLSPTDKLAYSERLNDGVAFAQTRNEIALILNDYKRPDAFKTLPNASAISAWFAKKTEIQALRKQFLYGQAPFTNASKRADLEWEIAKLFNNDPQMSALLSSSTVLADVESRWSSDLIADYNTTLSWEMGTTGKEELFMKNVWWTNVILSSRNVTTVGTSTESRLTFWIPNGSGKYEEWQLDTVAGVSVNCTWAGVDANGEFYLSIPWTAEFTYTKKFLNTLVQEAKNNPKKSTWGQLDTNDYNTTRMPNPKPAKYGISKTGTVRPS